MKITCENVVRCGNSNCRNNRDGYYCSNIVVALDGNGKCALIKPKIKAEADAREKAAAETNFSVTQTAQTTEAIICSKCHAHIPEGQKFCSECGTKVEIPETTQFTGSTAKVCPGCGAQVPDGRKFCGECGTKVDSGIQANPTHCKNCGAEIPRGRKFCGECGFRVS